MAYDSKTRTPDSAPLSGILVLDKPLRMSSMTAVAIVRRKAGGVKTGHAGTLDPLAGGVLVLALGAATRSIDRLMATDKRYRTVIDLSAFTTTDDMEGQRSEPEIAAVPDEQRLRNVLGQFSGRIMQRPPAFSAVKVAGRRAYRLARQGQAVELPPRPVMVHSIELVSFTWPLVELDIHCGKGFYVRSFARDLGLVLQTGGHCTAIRRTAVGPFTDATAVALDDLPATIHQPDLIETSRALRMVEEAEPEGAGEKSSGESGRKSG